MEEGGKICRYDEMGSFNETGGKELETRREKRKEEEGCKVSYHKTEDYSERKQAGRRVWILS